MQTSRRQEILALHGIKGCRERERVCTELIWKCTKHFSGHFGRFRISVSCDDAVGAPCQVYIAEKGCAKKVGELASGAAKAMSRSQASSLHIDVFFKELEVAKSFRSLAVVWAVFSAITSLLVPSCLFVLFCFVSNERRRETVSISPTWRISSTRRHKRQEERVFFGVKNNNNSTAVGDWLKNAPIPSIKISSLSFTVSARNIFSFPVWTDLLNRAGLPTACFVLFFVFFFLFFLWRMTLARNSFCRRYRAIFTRPFPLQTERDGRAKAYRRESSSTGRIRK